MTRQTGLAVKEPTTDAERAASHQFSGMVLVAVRDEDYAIGAKFQAALPAGANGAVVFRRNEIALEHYHTSVARIAGAHG